MKLSALCFLLLALAASTMAQSEDDIPVENDNQFPPDNVDGNVIDGSGAGAIEDPVDVTATTQIVPPRLIEDVQLSVSKNIEPTAEASGDSSCPKPCVCHVEGESNNFVVDCSGYDLTQFPTSIDTKTTTLNIQNNKLTEIPKEISSLKNLKVLNANNNSIMDLAAGSISELAELTVLKLGNNRLVEYPKDLKNGFGLTKLEELDLGGNDMRTSLNRDIFSHFSALKKLTLPSGAKDIVEDVCTSMKKTLVTVCTDSCDTKSFECPDAPQETGDDLFDFILPGTIALSSLFTDIKDPTVLDTANDKIAGTGSAKAEVSAEKALAPETNESEFSLRTAVNKAPDGISPTSKLLEAPKEVETSIDKKEGEVVEATTSETKTGGVNKSVIGIVVAGMVLVVAGITIKKNWSSIRKRFSSTPQAANERPGANTNGTAPEEVPLQEKSPV